MNTYCKLLTLIFLPGILLILSINIVLAQDTDADFQSWIDYTPIIRINKKIDYTGDMGLRGVLSGNEWTKIYANPQIRFWFRPKLTLHGGVALHYTIEEQVSNQFEIRPWQGVELFWPQILNASTTHYIRLEERFSIYTQESRSDFALRLRYRFQIKSANLTIKAINQSFYLLLSLELFVNLGRAIEEKYVDRNRLLLGVGHEFHRNWRWEVHYINQGSRRGSEEGIKTSDHILRIRVKTTFRTLVPIVNDGAVVFFLLLNIGLDSLHFSGTH